MKKFTHLDLDNYKFFSTADKKAVEQAWDKEIDCYLKKDNKIITEGGKYIADVKPIK